MSSYTEEIPVAFDWNGSTLLGVHHRTSHPFSPGVLYVHGLPGDRADARRLPVRMARRLQTQGIAGLRVDLYASGVSSGEFYSVTYQNELEQILFLIREIHRRQLWSGPLILLGYSQAAKLVLAAARAEQAVNGMCFWSGILTRERSISVSERQASAVLSPSLRRAYIKDQQVVLEMGYGQWLAPALLRDVHAFSVDDHTSFPPIACCAIYGSEDSSTRESALLLQQAGREVAFIAGADHLFTNTAWEDQLMQTTETWLWRTFAHQGG